MEPYLFQGVVRPERAQLTLQLELGFTHASTGIPGVAKVNIVLNQIAVWIEGEYEWDVFDLRNVVKNILQGQLDIIGFLKGYAYDLEITRVLNPSLGIDYVFGIDISFLSELSQGVDIEAEMANLRNKSVGPNGIYVGRCLNDLISAMKHADDTGFYCYRGIESLRHHCATLYGLTQSAKSNQWAKFREIACCDEGELRLIKEAADPLRHGQTTGISAVDRNSLLTSAWSIVRKYLANV